MSYQLTPEHAKLWLPVVRELREYYEGKNDKFRYLYNCPLCRVARRICQEARNINDCNNCDGMDEYCDFCLWFLFEGLICPAYAINTRIERQAEWCKWSIERLKRWERELKKIIKEKNKKSSLAK